MTRFENAAQSPNNMSVMIAFCIAAYLETHLGYKFTNKELQEFMLVISDDIEEWLGGEFESPGK